MAHQIQTQIATGQAVIQDIGPILSNFLGCVFSMIVLGRIINIKMIRTIDLFSALINLKLVIRTSIIIFVCVLGLKIQLKFLDEQLIETKVQLPKFHTLFDLIRFESAVLKSRL